MKKLLRACDLTNETEHLAELLLLATHGLEKQSGDAMARGVMALRENLYQLSAMLDAAVEKSRVKNEKARAAPADPILGAIAAYRTGCKAYADHPLTGTGEDTNDEIAEEIWGKHLDALTAWTDPAVTRAGAIEALRVAREQTTAFDNGGLCAPMLNAALAYFDGGRS